jgi:Tol biopolymer transport system component
MEASRGVGARLTTNGANDWFPHPSPDGQKIVFASDRDGGSENVAYVKNSAEPGMGEDRLMEAGRDSYPDDWSHDGKWIMFRTFGPKTGQDLWMVPPGDSTHAFPFLATAFVDAMGRFSTDDHWIAYNSTESGRWEIYVRPFNGASAGPEGKIRVSNIGGYFAVWSRDGKELFFLGADLKLYSVNTVDFSRPNASPQPTLLFTPCSDTLLAPLPLPLNSYDYPFDVTPDGRRFLFNCLASKPNRLDVMLNWQEELKQRVPTK